MNKFLLKGFNFLILYLLFFDWSHFPVNCFFFRKPRSSDGKESSSRSAKPDYLPEISLVNDEFDEEKKIEELRQRRKALLEKLCIQQKGSDEVDGQKYVYY